MTEFDNTSYDSLMSRAVSSHNEGDYTKAKSLAEDAYYAAPENSLEKIRAARDIGARHERLGDNVLALEWLQHASATCDRSLADPKTTTREELRERGITDIIFGASMLRSNLNDDGDPINTGDISAHIVLGWEDLKDARKQVSGLNGLVDHYQINASRRVSASEGLIGSPRKGLLIGVQAVALAFWSESPRIDTSTPNLDTAQRLRAKAKALVGGLAALTINVLSATDTDKGNEAAAKIATKVL